MIRDANAHDADYFVKTAKAYLKESGSGKTGWVAK